MIHTLKKGETSLTTMEASALDLDAVKEALWIDLLNPTDEERGLVEKALDLGLPSKEEMLEIEESSRLFEEDGALFMSCWLLCYDSPIPINTSVTFVITRNHFLSIRHSDHHAFRVFSDSKKRKQSRHFRNTGDVYAELMDAAASHIAYTLRLVEQDLNDLSVEIFAEQKSHVPKSKPAAGLRRVVKRLGKRNSLVASLRESSVSLSMITPFFVSNGADWIEAEVSSRLRTIQRDVHSLGEYNGQLSSEIAFLLDSTVGLINFEQNQMMKWLGAAAILVAFL